MVTYLARSAWGARPARGTALVGAEVRGVAFHWPGMAKPLTTQAQVASALRGWQAYHMDDRGWSDIAYQVAIDQAGRAWILRGLTIRSGANGDGTVNRQYGAILLVLAPGEKPSAAMQATARGVVTDFRRWFPAGRLLKGHRDVRPGGTPDQPSTDCPGPLAYAALKDGAFTPGSPLPDNPSKDWFDMATPEQIEEAVFQGTLRAHRQYGKELFKDDSGSVDAMWDQARAHRAAEIERLDKIVTNTTPKP